MGSPLSFTGDVCSGGALGDPCDSNPDCDSGFCVSRRLIQPNDSLCEAGQLGDPCDDDLDCAEGSCNTTCQL